MPELPEVEVMRRYLEEAALGKTIASIGFHDPLDKVYKSSREELQDALEGAIMKETQRRGKYLFVALSSGPWLHIHFGMTGNLELFPGDELPSYTRLVWNFEGGDRLAFRDLRKFGVLKIIASPEQFCRDHKLGTDLLDIELQDFEKALQDRKVAIKAALLDQKHFAGIGNWIADEMLFNCGIHPGHVCRDLSADSIRCLHQQGQRIVEEAIQADTHYGNFPPHFFVNYRKAEALHPDWPASPVQKLTVGGRSTFYVPARQKLPPKTA